MDITFYKLENNAIVKVDQDIKAEDWNKKVDWINCRTDSRKEVVEYFQVQINDQNARDCIENPGAYPFSNTFGNTIILNLSISNVDDIYKTDYLTLIFEKNLIFTIVPPKSDIFSKKILSTYSKETYPSVGDFIFYIVAVKTLAQSNINMSIARSRLQGLEHLISSEPEEISSNDLMSCERDINQLSDIIEDQYVGFEILASVYSSSRKRDDIQQTRDTIKGFEPLDKAMQRLEKRAESLRNQFMIYQQEKSTRKINLLTIIQAIFVPLTFIAGVYGMNFIVMPELNWKYGYLLVWIVFVVLAAGLLSYFYRKGWFD